MLQICKKQQQESKKYFFTALHMLWSGEIGENGRFISRGREAKWHLCGIGVAESGCRDRWEIGQTEQRVCVNKEKGNCQAAEKQIKILQN